MPKNNTSNGQEQAPNKQDFLNWIKTVYPVDKFDISDKHGKPITLIRTTNIHPFDESEKDRLIYYVCETNISSKTVTLPATIQVFPKEKRFNFLVEREYSGKGYGKTIYNNVQAILETLGIDDKGNYSITIASQKDHPFLQHMRAQDLLTLANEEPNFNNAQILLSKLESHPHDLSLSVVNSIIKFARKSGISDLDISNALNSNQFRIKPSSIADEALETFRNFNIQALKTTNMHQTIMKYRDSSVSGHLALLLLVSPDDKENTSEELKQILADVEELITAGTIKEPSIPDTVSPLEKAIYHLFGWYSIGAVLQNLTPEMQTYIKSKAIDTIDHLDPERTYSSFPDPTTFKIAQTLRNMPLTKEDYISMYMKALNRNFTLIDFQAFNSNYGIFDAKTTRVALDEIGRNIYYPTPKNNWSRINPTRLPTAPKIKTIPLSQKGLPTDLKGIRDKVKDCILQDGTAPKTKITTDMTGTRKGKQFKVTNLKDWLFGVPGAKGNLKLRHSTSGPQIILPPQTPREAIRIIEHALEEKLYSHPDDFGNR